MEETILAIIKAILPTIETIVIADEKQNVLAFLAKRLVYLEGKLAEENIAILHDKIMHGLIRDEADKIAIEGRIAINKWATEQVNSYEVTAS
jgi:hypothetical protein